MKKTDCKTIELNKGTVYIYESGNTKLHVYNTKDPISDLVFIMEKSGRAVVIEAPCFHDNIAELGEYISTLGAKVEARLLSYHMAGDSFLPDVPVYTTANAAEYGIKGAGAGLISNFTDVFGEAFDAKVPGAFEYVEGGECEIAGMRFGIIPTGEAFDVALPEMNAVYTHMLGHDCHSIIAGPEHADAIIAQLNQYIADGYELILTSHYLPEDVADVRTKIEYIKAMKQLAAGSNSADAFKAAANKKFPGYSGDNYLDMTAGFFFPA